MNWPGHHNPANKTPLQHIVEVVDWMADRLYREILPRLERIEKNQGTIMNTLDEVLADVNDESTKLDSLGTFVAGLKQQIADALTGVAPLPPAVQTKLDAVFSAVEANKAKVVAAMDANVPPPPPPDQPAV